MKLNDDLDSLSEHSQTFNTSANKNNMRDKSNYLLISNNKICSLVLEVHEGYHSLTSTF